MSSSRTSFISHLIIRIFAHLNNITMFKIITIFLISALANLSYANEPKEVLEAFYTAMAAGNQAEASEYLASDVMIYESGYVEQSRNDYAKHHLPEDIAFAKASTRLVLRQNQRIDGSLAIIWQETETKARIKGKDQTLLGTETVLLQKSGDSWLITHVHWSSRKLNKGK